VISQLEYVSTVGALDKLLSQALESTIKKKLGQQALKKIEQRLQDRYGLNISEAIKDFHIFDATLREFFGTGADTMEEDFKEHIVSLNASAKGRTWLTIENQDLVNLILESYGDHEKRIILNTALKSPNVTLEILEKCEIPKSSGYRIISELIENGLLTEEGFAKTSDGKTVSKYTALFEKVKIEIGGDNALVQVLLKEHILEESSIFKILIKLRS
ncbi:MAG: hypothetical protein ACHQW9_01120, partial [Nitrososphaerales archaeon]